MPVSNVRASIIGVVAFLIGAVAMIPILYNHGVFDPQPYRVLNVEHWAEDKTLRVKVNFIKDGCKYEKGIVWGTYFGEIDPRPITWENIPGNIGDRTLGEHTVDLRIGPLILDYEEVEMRTRHDCDGETIDGVLFKVKLK